MKRMNISSMVRALKNTLEMLVRSQQFILSFFWGMIRQSYKIQNYYLKEEHDERGRI